jgi:hypothetical protein
MKKLELKKIAKNIALYLHPMVWDVLYTTYQKSEGNIKFEVAISQNVEALIIITILSSIISYNFWIMSKMNNKINVLAFDHAMLYRLII